MKLCERPGVKPGLSFPDRDETAETGIFGLNIATIPDHPATDNGSPGF
jgi:hypothetical protein